MTNERFPSQAHKSVDTGRGSMRPPSKSQTFFFPSQPALTTSLPLHACKHTQTYAQSHTHINTHFLCTLSQMACFEWHPRCSPPIRLWRSGLADWHRNTSHKIPLQLGVVQASKWRAFKPAPLKGPSTRGEINPAHSVT